ncbi:MAG: DNA-binding protein [Vicinamibacterales bacterium]
MNVPQHGLWMAAVLAVVSGVAAAALAQPTQGRRQGGPMYDARTEARFTGSVVEVQDVVPPVRSGRRSLGGTHLTLKTTTESLDVHLGPTAFLKDRKVELVQGDAVEILGSPVTLDGESVLLAREIKKGESTWTLRDATGRPLWAPAGDGST